MATTCRPPDELLYPSEDMVRAESHWHNKQVHLLVDMLQRRFAARSDAFVANNIFLLDYQDSREYERVVPDVLVAFGVASVGEPERDSYRVWKEGMPPAVIIEIGEGDTQYESALSIAEPYFTIGVAEYYLFDPEAAPPAVPLQGYRRTAEGRYVPLKGPILSSAALGLEMLVVDDFVRLRDPATGRLLLTSLELAQELDAAEAEIARLRAELARRQDGG